MSITFDSKLKTFHLQTPNTSYMFQVYRSGYLVHLYWGKKIRTSQLEHFIRIQGRAFGANPDPKDAHDRSFSLDTMLLEYPAYGNSDYRHPAYQVQLENGTTVTDLRYSSHRIYKGKPKLEGLPATYVENDNEADTLEVELVDPVAKLKAVLTYTAYNDHDVITRSARFENTGEGKLKLLQALSVGVDFSHSDFEMLHLSGSWARERYIQKRKLAPGIQSIESRRGASSHQHNPFVALMGRDACEDHGEVYGFSLVYSGNFIAQAEVDDFSTTRVTLGINPFDFSGLLEPGEAFQTPEVVMVYSDNGLGGMSRIYHRLYRTRLCRGTYRDNPRPILVNNWEATYFNFDADKIESIARTGKELGIELMVLDDGWFGRRDTDNCSLGDWIVDKKKLPKGLNDLAKRVNNLGMKFGLWFEPEMVSPDSDLYRAHPDWCLHVPDRYRSMSRMQLILDMSRKDICDYIIKSVSDVLRSAPISYVKWDMNRHMTEIGSALLPPERQRETAHRYILGVYRVMEEITSAFPDVLFESCSGGGGRFDPGILYYMPQTWTSDDTDAIERLRIQYGTSVVYPASSMGAHVSAVPNHQVSRITPLETRGNVAMSGNFGYELDLTKFTEKEKEAVSKQVALYKELRPLIQFGDFYRLENPFEGNAAAWMFVSEDKSEAFAVYVQVLAQPNARLERIRLKGLDPNKDYEIVGSSENEVCGGDQLMYAGLNVPELHGDFRSVVWRFKAV